MADITRGRENVNYNYGQIVTPFNKERQNWDRPIGSWREKAANWRLWCFTLIVCNIVFALLFLSLLSEPKQQIFVAQTQKNGFVEAVGFLNQSSKVMQDVTGLFLNHYLQSMTYDQSFAKEFTEAKAWPEVQKTFSTLGSKQAFNVMSVRMLKPGVVLLIIGYVPEGQNAEAAKHYALSFNLTRQDGVAESLLAQNPLALYVTGVSLTEIGK